MGDCTDTKMAPQWDAPSMSATPVPVIRVERARRGRWRVVLAGGNGVATCETLADARRLAYLSAGRCRPCELVVRDAYDHVIADELLTAGDERRP